MSSQSLTNSSSLCGNVSDLTNPDISGVGVLASYLAGAALILVHQVSFAISILPPRLHSSFTASSLTLLDTASVLAISWQVAALSQLQSSVQTTHNALMISLTAYASIVITLGALCTTWSHMRRHWYRLSFCLMSILLSLPVTLLADKSIRQDQFPLEACLPFFKTYLPMMRKSFILLTVVFWVCVTLMVALLLMSPFGELSDANVRKRPPIKRWAEKSRVYVFLVLEVIFLVLVVLVNHFFVPEQVLRKQARGQLAEGHWSFGQIVGMLIWLPVTAEFVFIFWFGSEEGLEGRLPTSFVAAPKHECDVHGRELLSLRNSPLTMHQLV